MFVAPFPSSQIPITLVWCSPWDTAAHHLLPHHAGLSGDTILQNLEIANDLLCETNFNEILDPTDVQRRWSQFKAVFLDIMEQCIPKAVLPQRRNLPWLTKEILQLIEKRNYYFKKAHSNRNSSDLLKFKQLRNKVVSKLRLAKQKFFS